MRKIVWIVFCVIALSFISLSSCRDWEDLATEENGSTDTSENQSSNKGEVNESDEDYSWDSNSTVALSLNGNSIAVDGEGVTVNKSVAIIDSSGNYSISGSLSDGQIVVNTGDEGIVRLILDGVDITNTEGAPIYIQRSAKTILVLSDGSNNILSDGTSYKNSSSEDTPNAALYSSDDLTIYGEGTLTVNANYNDGITSKDGLIIASGTIKVTATDDGIRGKDYLVIETGNITVNSGGDGLKSDNDTDDTAGYIQVLAGTIDITSATDGFSAKTNVTVESGDITIVSGGGSENGRTHSGGMGGPGGFPGSTTSTTTNTTSIKGIKAKNMIRINGGTLKINSADDALHTGSSIMINGGNLTLASGDDGIHADESVTMNNCEINLTTSYEGIESMNITVDNSKLWLVSTDDGFNATAGTVSGGTESNDGSLLTINSGYVCVNASSGDAIDSNGDIAINGGTIIAHGPSSQPEVGMDVNGACKVKGGTVIISGSNSNMTEAPSSSSTQNSVLIMFSSNQSASSLVDIQDSKGNNILTFAPVRAYQSIILSSADLETGESYTVYTGGTCTGTPKDGRYSGGNYSGGKKYTAFTISGKVTQIGNAGNNMGGR